MPALMHVPHRAAHRAHELASEIVQGIRDSAHGALDDAHIYLPITSTGSDVRIVIESSRSVAAATEIQRMAAGGMQLQVMPFTDAIRAATDLLLKQVQELERQSDAKDNAQKDLLFEVTTSLIMGMTRK